MPACVQTAAHVGFVALGVGQGSPPGTRTPYESGLWLVGGLTWRGARVRVSDHAEMCAVSPHALTYRQDQMNTFDPDSTAVGQPSRFMTKV